jgi:uncharacterized protein
VRALLDVNVLIALLDEEHVSHSAALDWYAENLELGWASCPITENGTARVMSSAGYPNPLPVAAILQRLGQAKHAGYHEFWADNVSLTDTAIFDHAALLGPKQITDRYLLALAVKNNGRFVTFDQGIRPTAVAGASRKHLLQLRG